MDIVSQRLIRIKSTMANFPGKTTFVVVVGILMYTDIQSLMPEETQVKAPDVDQSLIGELEMKIGRSTEVISWHAGRQ